MTSPTTATYWAVACLPKQDPAAVLEWACRLYTHRHGADPTVVRVAPALLPALDEAAVEVVGDDRLPARALYFPLTTEASGKVAKR